MNCMMSVKEQDIFEFTVESYLYWGFVLANWIVPESLMVTAARILCSIAIGSTA